MYKYFLLLAFNLEIIKRPNFFKLNFPTSVVSQSFVIGKVSVYTYVRTFMNFSIFLLILKMNNKNKHFGPILFNLINKFYYK